MVREVQPGDGAHERGRRGEGLRGLGQGRLRGEGREGGGGHEAVVGGGDEGVGPVLLFWVFGFVGGMW